jgi:hypothetical protein
MECYCDYDPADVYDAKRINSARKPHKCEECGRQINPGEPYESAFMIYDGCANTYPTCQHCLALRNFVQISIPCFCWAHGRMHDDARACIEDATHRARDEMKGVAFRAMRFAVAIEKAKSAPRSHREGT